MGILDFFIESPYVDPISVKSLTKGSFPGLQLGQRNLTKDSKGTGQMQGERERPGSCLSKSSPGEFLERWIFTILFMIIH